MKRIRLKMDGYLNRLDDRWRALPVNKQHKYTLYFFIGYVLLTIAVIIHVWQSSAKSRNDMVIEHIENPVLKKKESPAVLQDKLQEILKK